MTTAEEVDDMVEEDAMITVDTAEMIVTVDTAEIAMMDTPLVESTDMLATTDTAAVVVMTDVEVVEDTLIVMTEETVAPLARRRLQPPMVIQPLVEKVGNHTEVDATMMMDQPIAIIDC